MKTELEECQDSFKLCFEHNKKLQEHNAKMREAIKKFCHRCEIGEVISRKTYAEFCQLLEEIK